jgi:uncharacterized protein (DUF924 family)
VDDSALTEEEIASIDEILQFWFGDADASPEALKQRIRAWFMSGGALDEEIAARFADTLAAASSGRLSGWTESPRGRLALILVLDQFPRNIHRGTARAFQFDADALAHCLEGLELGQDKALGTLERVFFFMPLQHAEDKHMQALAVEHFSALIDECAQEHKHFHTRSADSARKHREIVERFGRYPHRNRVLGRTNTDDEDAYLAGDSPTFGQK